MKTVILNLLRTGMLSWTILLGACVACAQTSSRPAAQVRSQSIASQDGSVAVPQQPAIAFDQIDRIVELGYEYTSRYLQSFSLGS